VYQEVTEYEGARKKEDVQERWRLTTNYVYIVYKFEWIFCF